MLLLTNMVKKQKIDVVGIITTGGNNSCRTKHTIEWLRYLELEKEISVASSRDIDKSAQSVSTMRQVSIKLARV